ncbi:MAG: photosynthetic reaction center subunit H [Pseudomonadota bacterium]
MLEPFYGTFDLASLTLWLFWIFFALLIYYLQTENMREGYPLETDDGVAAPNQGPFPLLKPKRFRLRDGRGDKFVPDNLPEARDVALERVGPGLGYPLEPTGDPMADGVGPASWAPRRDAPELDAHGHIKIQPMSQLPDFRIAAGKDPRGLPVIGGDGMKTGEVVDLWVDVPEQMIRYLHVRLDDGTGDRILPFTMARIWFGEVRVHALYGHQFTGVPLTKTAGQITLLEEDKISAYYGGGTLYADIDRQDPQL